jgi:TPP-dependent pyruvate/acetoin dehydrogenase alpha subunit
MPLERARRSVERIRQVARGELRLRAAPLRIDASEAVALFESQLTCRLLDVEANALRARNQGYYTICSAGHEGNVALGRLSRLTDPALLHYRSGALFQERARKVPEVDAILDLCLSLSASADDPISAGRHKVFGSVPLFVPPQTSTIASHLPKAVGYAIALQRAARLGFATREPADSIVICSFGDASLNHSTAQGAINAASWVAYQKLPCPVLFVCEDNTLGVSVRTPDGWVESSMRSVPAMHYVKGDGRDLSSAYEATRRQAARARRAPRHLAYRIPQALHRPVRACYPRRGLFGEDVAKKGGVYHVTAGPVRAHVRRPARVQHDARRDDHPRPGAGLHAQAGGLPFPEIQYLAYLHNAIDQIRGEAASLQFFSNEASAAEPDGRAHRRPRLPEGLRRPLPQRQLASARCSRSPARSSACRRAADDAVRMLRTMTAAAKQRRARCQRVPGADRALHAEGPARGRRRPVAVPLSAARAN